MTDQYIPAGGEFRLAVMNCHYVRFSLTYFLDSVQRFGFRYIELFGAMPHFFLDDVDDALVHSVAEACRTRGLGIVSFCPAQGAYPMNIAVQDAQIRKRTRTMLKKAIRIAGMLGCETMLVSPGYGYYDRDPEEAWENSRESLKELGKTAEEHNVILIMEPLTRATANLVNTSADAARMIREVELPSVKSMMDLGVMNAMGETVDDYFRNLGADLRYIHFTDGPGAHVALGDGSFPMAQYLEDIRRNGYQGVLSFEINDRRYFTAPDRALAQNVKWLRENGLSRKEDREEAATEIL